jgi:hypothetical protein
MYTELQILVIWNNHEFGVLMNGSVKYVENQGKNSECMHVKCKYVATVIFQE